MSLRYNFPRWVSESPCVLCRADRILASYLFGSTFSSSGIEVLLVAPVCLQDQSFDAQRRFGSFRAFQHPRPLPLAPSPKPPPSIARGQKGTLLKCLYCITGASWSNCPLLGKGPKQKDQKVSPPSSPHPPLQLHSNVWTHLVTRTICKSGLGTTLWTVPTQDI